MITKNGIEELKNAENKSPYVVFGTVALTPMHIGIGLSCLLIPTVLFFRCQGMIRYIFVLLLVFIIISIYRALKELGVGIIVFFLEIFCGVVIFYKIVWAILLLFILSSCTLSFCNKMIEETLKFREALFGNNKLIFRRWIVIPMVLSVVIPSYFFANSTKILEFIIFGILIIVGWLIGSFLPWLKIIKTNNGN